MSDSLVVIDWGTTSFRAIFLDSQGEEVDSISNDRGVGKLNREGMVEQVVGVQQRWDISRSRIYACGMIGSSIGWHEVGYTQCPVSAADIAAATELVDFLNGVQIRILPGVKFQGADGNWDVMRGEELQAMGWAAMQPVPSEATGICVMPGTHSKWVKMKNGCIEEFFTAMTGELFALLKTHSLLRHHIAEDVVASQSFFDGVEVGATEHGLGRHLFSVRGNSLLGDLSPDNASAFTSGLLIGAEIADASQLYGMSKQKTTSANSGPVNIIGASKLSSLYQSALEHLDIQAEVIDSHKASVAGFTSIDRLI